MLFCWSVPCLARLVVGGGGVGGAKGANPTYPQTLDWAGRASHGKTLELTTNIHKLRTKKSFVTFDRRTTTEGWKPKIGNTFVNLNSRNQYYKTFCGRKLWLFIINKSVCPWQAFPAQSNVCE
jgi:hypothetical protein